MADELLGTPQILVVDGQGKKWIRFKSQLIEENSGRGKKERIMALGDGKAASVSLVIEDEGAEVIDMSQVGTSTLIDPQPEAPAQANVLPTEQVVAATQARTITPAVEAALHKRYEFWKDKLSHAASEAEVEAATDSLERIKVEAGKAGVNLEQASRGTVAIAASAVGKAGQGSAKKSKKAARGKENTVPQSVLDKEAASSDKARRLAAQTAEKPAGEAKSVTEATGVRVTRQKVQMPCLDGCGAMVNGKFQMGHDAKLKSLLLKVEKGEIPPEAIPDVVQDLVKIKIGELEILKDSTGQKTVGQLQHYVILAAPVKFNGRPEIQLTDRAQE